MSTACPFLNFSIEHNSCSVSKASTKTRQGAQFKLTSNHTPLVFFFFFLQFWESCLLTRMIKIVIMNSCKLLFIYIMVERILQIKYQLQCIVSIWLATTCDEYLSEPKKLMSSRRITWLTTTALWSWSCCIIISQTVVFPDAAPPATPGNNAKN